MKKILFMCIGLVPFVASIHADDIWIVSEIEKFLELNEKCYAQGADADISPCQKARAKAKQLQKFASKNLHALYKLKIVDENMITDATSGNFNDVKNYFSRDMSTDVWSKIQEDSYAASYKILYDTHTFNFSDPKDIATIKTHIFHLFEVLSTEDFYALNIGHLYEVARDNALSKTSDLTQ